MRLLSACGTIFPPTTLTIQLKEQSIGVCTELGSSTVEKLCNFMPCFAVGSLNNGLGNLYTVYIKKSSHYGTIVQSDRSATFRYGEP